MKTKNAVFQLIWASVDVARETDRKGVYESERDASEPGNWRTMTLP